MGLFFDQNLTYSPTDSRNIHTPYEQFTYQPQLDYTYSPSIIWNSPNSSLTGATVTTKKEATSRQSEENTASGSTLGTQQDYFTPILILGGLAVVGLIAVKYLGKKK